MNRRQFTKFSRRLTRVLGEGGITRLGRTTGFTQSPLVGANDRAIDKEQVTTTAKTP